MPSFTPYKSVQSPRLRFNRAPNVFLLKDGTIVESGSPHENTVSKVFLFGHEPSGVSNDEAKLLIDYGFSLIPDGVMWHEIKAPILGSGFTITVGVNDGPFARGVSDYLGAFADFTVLCENNVVRKRPVQWFPADKEIRFQYILDSVRPHRVEVVLRNNAFSLDPYVVEWSS